MTRKQIRFLLRKGLLKRRLGWVFKPVKNKPDKYSSKEIFTERYFTKRTIFFGLVKDNVLYFEQVPLLAYLQKLTIGFTTWKSNAPTHYLKYDKL